MEAAKRNAPQAGTGEANNITNQTVVVDNTADATRKQVLEHAEHLAHLPLFDGAKSTAPSDELDLRPLFFQQSGAADPSRARDKAAGLATIPTNEMPVTRSGFAPATMIALTIDFDDGNLDADDVQAETRNFFGSKTIAAAYSTASSLPEARRWRVVVPFSEALVTNEWLRLGRGFARFCESAGIVVDKSMERVGQISFLPNVPFSLTKKDGSVVALRDPFSGDPLHFEHVRWGEQLFDAGALTDIATGVLQELDASDAAEAQKLAEQALERARKHDEREALRAQQMAAGMDTLTPVERFKVEHSTESLLAKYGYIEDPQKPGNWRSPLQTSGTFATQVREDGSWFSLSGSDADAGLGTAQAGGRGGDAFDLFAFFEHGGNYRKAVAAVSPPVGGDITAFAGVPVPVGSAASSDPNVILQMFDTLANRPLSPDALSLCFERIFAGQYLSDGRRWYKWDGTRWQASDLTNAEVVDTMRNLCRRANRKGQVGVSGRNFTDGALYFAENSPTFRRSQDSFDTDNYTMATPGGVVDLRTGAIAPATPEMMLSKCTAAAPQATVGVTFLRFLDEVCCGDKDLAHYLQVMLGSCLSGAVENHWIGFMHGFGRNGKNTLLDLILHVMGDYAKKIPSNVLMTAKHERHPAELADLRGVRLALSSEIEDGAHWNESRINELTGDATISARRMREDPTTFRRTWKHIVLGNHRPQLRSNTAAVINRFKIVEFKADFAGREDETLPSRLQAEAGFVMHWLIEGHRMWIEGGRKLPKCSAVDAATKDYFESQANAAGWLRERCEIISTARTPISVAYNDYVQWHAANGTHAEQRDRFVEALKRDRRLVPYRTERERGLKGFLIKPPVGFSAATLSP